MELRGRERPCLGQTEYGQERRLRRIQATIRISPSSCSYDQGNPWHVELWIPSDKPMDIYALKVPTVALRPVNEVPLFDWARQQEVQVWKDLERAHRTKDRRPEPPEVHQCLWAPSGMEHMDARLSGPSRRPRVTPRKRWRFHYGTWLPGPEKRRRPSRFYLRAAWGSARVVARLLELDGDIEGAKAFDPFRSNGSIASPSRRWAR